MKNLKKWMKPQKRKTDFILYPGASNRVVPQPLGLVGVIVPWNFPLNLTFCPLAAIFAAGNRAMVKMSENSSHLAQVLAEISPKYFSEDKLKFFQESGGLGHAFSLLPFDHIIFTGSATTGRSVMTNAAKNLTPVTLELGGKSPAIVSADFSLQKAAERIMWAKLFNAGQICTSIDYVFIPEDSTEEFVHHCKRIFSERIPDVNGDDYTSIIDERSYVRLEHLLEDARVKGATLINLSGSKKQSIGLRKFSPYLVLHLTADMQLSKQEIFGPILPILTYRNKQEVVDYINSLDRPLALYLFTHDKSLQEFIYQK